MRKQKTMLKKYNRHKISINSYIAFTEKAFVFFFSLIFIFSIMGCGKAEKTIDVFNSDSGVATANELPMPSTDSTENSKQLVIGMPSDLGDLLHPLAVKEEELSNLYSLIFDPCLRLDSEGKPEPYVIQNWEIDETGCVYTFHIQRGIKFQGGFGTVSADDIINSLDKIMAADSSQCIYARYKGAVVSYEKIDDYTFKLTTSEKSRDVLYLMTFPVMPKAYYGSKNITAKGTLPVGTGAYAVSSYSEADGFTLTRNGEWWRTLPVYETIIIKPLDTSTITIGSTALEDFNAVTTSIYTANSFSVAGKTSVYPIMTAYFDCLVPNISDRFLKDASIRQAISYAIDRSMIISSGLMGLGEATVTPISPSFWATSDSSYAAISCDIEKAKSILDEAGYQLDETTGFRYIRNADGSKKYLQINLLYTESTDFEYRKTVTQIIKENLAKIGIEITPIKETAENYLGRLASGDFDISLCNFAMYTNNDIQFLFADPYNYGKYSSGNLSTLLSACASAVSDQEIKTSFESLEGELINSMPVIGLYFKEHALIADADISITTKLLFKSAYASINEWK